jgi:hypothetical protein
MNSTLPQSTAVNPKKRTSVLDLAWSIQTSLRNKWLAAFILGALSAVAFPILGYAWPVAHDTAVLPVLYRVLLPFPNRWLISGGLVLLALFFSDSRSFASWISGALLGLWLGVMIACDWWYFIPFMLALMVAFALWRAHWFLWSSPVSAVGMTLLALGVVGLGAVLDIGRSVEWDNRFGFGGPLAVNRLATAGLVLVFIAASVIWGLWHGKRAMTLWRQLLTDLVEREPRMGVFLAISARLTRLRIPGGGSEAARFASATSSGPAMSVVWRSWRNTCTELKNRVRHWLKPRVGEFAPADGIFPDRVPFRHGLDVLWAVGYVIAANPLSAWLFRRVRPAVRVPGFPSVAIRNLLQEGVERQHQAFMSVCLNGDATEAPVFARMRELNEQQFRERQSRVNHAFGRYIMLREAQIEAKLYFGLTPPVLDASSIDDCLERFKRADFRQPPEGAASSTSPGDLRRVWQKVANEYEALWFENCDRLMLLHGEPFPLPFFRPADFLDLNLFQSTLTGASEDSNSAAACVMNQLRTLAPSVAEILSGRGAPDLEKLRNRLAGAFNAILMGSKLYAAPEFEHVAVSEAVRQRVEALRGASDIDIQKHGRRLLATTQRKLLEAAFEGMFAVAEDPIDTRVLSSSWLAARVAGMVDVDNIHRAAADLALALFSVDPADWNRIKNIRDALDRRYLGQLDTAQKNAPLEGPAYREAGLCAALYCLWLTSQFCMNDALVAIMAHGGGLVSFTNPQFEAQSPRVLRAAVHFESAKLSTYSISDFLKEGNDGAPWLERFFARCRSLDNHPECHNAGQVDLLYDGQCRGEILACAFADHLLR